ncbi:OLC1v1012208C3 [Oldenlandia corymbosa var. corymbosa]|uniref:OLC1v1012208C3 n=1 Tax=Oldenlandia corymbosa var. corymbosa TaxID=529605 RepID=A0AAV1DXV0_OLDCO|nr:OLC1v1012208C3 [Oldenlandia corymbosa var. corymbosa]
MPPVGSAARIVASVCGKSSNLTPNNSQLGWLKNDISKINNVDDALAFFNHMVRMRPLPDVIDFNQLVTLVMKMKSFSVAILMYKSMCAEGIPIDVYTMSMVINCYCREGRVDLGFSVLGALFKVGLMPGVIIFNTILKGLFREHRVREAQELFSKIIYEKLCEPDQVTIGTVIDGLSKVGNTRKAIEVLRAMENGDTKPNTIIYNAIIDALCKDKMMDQALGLLFEMIKKGIAPSKWQEAKKLWTKMRYFGIAPDVVTYNIFIDSFSKGGLMKDANAVFAVMIRRGETPDILTHCSLMEGYSLQGQIVKARRVFDAMVAVGFVTDIIPYNILIHGYFKVRKSEEAMRLFLNMPCKGLHPSIVTYTILLQGLFQSGRCDIAKQIFSEMLLSTLKPNFYTWCVMLDGLCKSGHVDDALLLLLKMERDGEVLHVAMYNIIIDGFCKSGSLDRARDMFSSLSLKGFDPDVTTYNTMIDGLCMKTLLVEAKTLFDQMEANGCLADEITYNIMLRGFLKGEIRSQNLPSLCFRSPVLA